MTNDTACTADLLGFGPPPSASVAAKTPPPSSDLAGEVDLLGFGTCTHAPAAPAASACTSSAPSPSNAKTPPRAGNSPTENNYESPTAVASLQQNANTLDLLSDAPEVDRLVEFRAEAAAEEGEETMEMVGGISEQAPAAAGGGSAPALAGMSKITRHANGNGTRPATHQPKRRPRLIIPHRSIGMGLDVKFEEDPARTNLCNLLAPHEYRTIVAAINDDLREVRATGVDKALMATAPLVVPLAVFGKRQSKRSREKKMVLHEAIQRFNEDHPALRMMWTKSVAGDYLCIVERDDALDVPIAVNNQLPTGLE